MSNQNASQITRQHIRRGSKKTGHKPSRLISDQEREKRRRRLKRIDAKYTRIRNARDAEAAIWSTDTEVMALEGVSRFLKCSVQAVRNIPANELPRTRKPGRRLLFLREDVIAYVRRHQTQGTAADKNSQCLDDQIDSVADNVRRRST